MKKVVEFPVSVGDKVIYVSSDDFPFEPSISEEYVVNLGYNKYHDQFYVNISKDPKSLYGGEVYLDEFGVDAFLLDEEDKAKEVLNERLQKWRKKNKLKN